MIPRGLTWAASVEGILARFSGALVTVPAAQRRTLGASKSTAASTRRNGGSGLCRGTTCRADCPAGGQKALIRYSWLRYAEDGLYLAMRLPARAAAPQLNLGLLGLPSVPSSHSPRCFVLIEEDAVVASRHQYRGESRSWNCTWQVAASESGGMRCWEIFVPATADKPSPRPGDRWRLNCLAADPPGRWRRAGHAAGLVGAMPIPEHLEHGVVLVFGSKDVFGET